MIGVIGHELDQPDLGGRKVQRSMLEGRCGDRNFILLYFNRVHYGLRRRHSTEVTMIKDAKRRRCDFGVQSDSSDSRLWCVKAVETKQALLKMAKLLTLYAMTVSL